MFGTQNFTFKGRKYRNHNKLLFNYKGTDGIKTGYTRASGYNLAASVQRGDKHLIAVVIGGKTGSQRDTAMRALLDKNFAAASSTKPTAAQLVASLVAPPALPPVKKPTYASASAIACPGGAGPGRRHRRRRHFRAGPAAQSQPHHLGRPVAQAVIQTDPI